MSSNNGAVSDKLYILVRRDLSCSQRAVQACHAVAELLRKEGDDP